MKTKSLSPCKRDDPCFPHISFPWDRSSRSEAAFVTSEGILPGAVGLENPCLTSSRLLRYFNMKPCPVSDLEFQQHPRSRSMGSQHELVTKQLQGRNSRKSLPKPIYYT